MKKLFENWNVSVLKDEIYVVNIITTSKSIYVGRSSDTTYMLEDADLDYVQLNIPEFLPKDKKYMYAENIDKFHYQCFYIPYTMEDIKNTKTILKYEN